MHEVLYIHPKTPMTYPRNIPISIPALVKRIQYPVKGMCASKVRKHHISQAKVIFMDVHWFFSLKGAKELVTRCKRWNPSVLIIAGGITATEFPEQLVETIGVDYVLRGDGEIPLPMLVNALMTGGSLANVPNLIGKEVNNLFRVKPYKLTKSDFNENNFYDVSFFPYMERELQSLHRRNPGYPPFIYPFLLPFRGCPIECDFCGGAPDEQQKLFNRKVVYRSADRLNEDFNQLESIPWIRFYNCLLDYLTLMNPAYVEKALPKKKSRLFVQHEFTKAPDPEILELFLSRFSGGMIHFSVDSMHLTSEYLNDPDLMVTLIKNTQNNHPTYMPILDFSSVYVQSNPEYKKALQYIHKKTNCFVYDGSIWWSDFPKPANDGYASPDKFDHFMNNAITFKHFISNNLVGVMNIVDATMPKNVKILLRKLYYGKYYKRWIYG